MKVIFYLKTLLFVALFFPCCGVFGDALNNWHWRNPLPNGNPPPSPYNLYGIVFTNGTFFAVGDSGVIFTSPDGTNLAAPVWTTVATFNNASAITQWTNTAPVGSPCFFRLVSP
jgi:hypothetical protein